MSTHYVNVKFIGTPKTYVYLAELTPDELAAIESSKVTWAVVDSPNSGMTLVEAVSAKTLDLSTYTGDYKWIVQIVDTGAYEARQEKQRRRAAIVKDLERRKKEKLAAMQFRELLAGDPEAEALLKELEGL